ncbi:hypothetical protein AB8A21_33790, partial [Streptomyces sp. BF23-18]
MGRSYERAFRPATGDRPGGLLRHRDAPGDLTTTPPRPEDGADDAELQDYKREVEAWLRLKLSAE